LDGTFVLQCFRSCFYSEHYLLKGYPEISVKLPFALSHPYSDKVFHSKFAIVHPEGEFAWLAFAPVKVS
jgi:hypothetical protein